MNRTKDIVISIFSYFYAKALSRTKIVRKTHYVRDGNRVSKRKQKASS